ncbi:FAD:protein FMN transferase [Massilia pseudoviolaceinigra]|uniref:FAD:protein FMN transferase n=1 Tax=Massilia pseudoviolaceinigra TaxID=3057165 RepID=UPI002796BC4F|nr:FAD:protein FMN transferase [Massilia sp. CCM 9206]MDQ1919387.1 FAD:protein FMN transferase [Massilia sp. CCM 9206]
MDVQAFPFEAMASRCELRLGLAPGVDGARLAQVAIDEVLRIEATYSRYRTGGIVNRINHAAGRDPVVCDDETNALLDYARVLHATSGGLFDITSGVLRRAWDFRRPVLPAQAVLDALLALVGWQHVQREHGAIRLSKAGMEIDFGGFGKEYAADRAAALLAASGVRHGYVNLGGDLRIIGPRPDGAPWEIGVQDPRDTERLAGAIPIASGALATSGDYERFIDIAGKRYCHVLDPRSGMPVSHWRSVSVLGPLAIAAGSCSTIAMLMQEDGLAFLDNSGMAYLAIDQQGQCFRKDV